VPDAPITMIFFMLNLLLGFEVKPVCAPSPQE